MPFLHDAYVLKCRLHMHVCLGTCVRVSDLVSMYACAAVKQIQHLFSCKSVIMFQKELLTQLLSTK